MKERKKEKQKERKTIQPLFTHTHTDNLLI